MSPLPAAGNTRLGTELDELNTLAAAHGERVFLHALARAVAFGRWRAADVRSILAAGAGTPQPATAGDALVLTLPVVPTRPLSAYAIATPAVGATATADAATADAAPAQLGATRVGGVDLNKPRIRAALAAVLALSVSADGFTVAEFTAKAHAMTGDTHYTVRQAAYDLRKLRGKQLVTKPGRTHSYHLDPRTAGAIATLLTLREQVIGPILAGIRSPRMGRKPIIWTSVDRDYEKIRIDMQTLFQHLGIQAAA